MKQKRKINNYHLRDKDSCRFSSVNVKPEFLTYVKTAVVPLLELKNNKLNEKYDLIAQIISNMLEAHQKGKVLADSRNTGSNASCRIQLYNALLDAGILKVCIGSEKSKMVSRYAFTSKGEQLFKNLQISDVIDFSFDTPITQNRSAYDSNRAPVILRQAKKHKNGSKHKHNGKTTIPFPKRLNKDTLKYIRRLENRIMRINAHNLNHHQWEYPVNINDSLRLAQVNPCVRAIFNNDFKHGGRLYSRGISGYQTLSREERKNLLVDGINTAEVDFSGCQIRMLYHLKEIDFREDVYMTDYVFPVSEQHLLEPARDFIKTLTNIIINTDSLKCAKRAAGNEYHNNLNDDLKEAIYKDLKTTPSEIIEKIISNHAPIKNYFFTEISKKLQLLEAQIITSVLMSFIKHGIPALSLHDAIICRNDNTLLAQKLMIKFYNKKFGFNPVIKINRIY